VGGVGGGWRGVYKEKSRGGGGGQKKKKAMWFVHVPQGNSLTNETGGMLTTFQRLPYLLLVYTFCHQAEWDDSETRRRTQPNRT